MCEEYNGWTNYPTWAVNVHDAFTDREDLGEMAYAAYAAGMEDPHTLGRDADGVRYFAHGAAQRAVADAMREEMEDAAIDNLSGGGAFWSDIIGWAIGEIDFWRLAEGYADDAATEYAAKMGVEA
jgi:hypothetical protein